MGRPALRRLALAVALIFATFGPINVLIQSANSDLFWVDLVSLTLLAGGFAAALLLNGHERNKIAWITIAFVALMLTRVEIISFFAGDKAEAALTGIDAEGIIRTRRQVAAFLAMAFIASGYAVFLRVVNREVEERTSLEIEMDVARKIQQSLLPAKPFKNKWCEIYGVTKPTLAVGGDFFDIVEIGNDKVLVAIADVSGHGVGASIMAATTKGVMRSQIGTSASLTALLANLNKTLYGISDKQTFVTFAAILFDFQTQIAHIATAGHPPVLHFQKEEKRLLHHRSPNLAVALTEKTEFTLIEQPFSRGDDFLLYTDGILEPHNVENEDFGEDRLHEAFLESLDLNLQARPKHIIHAAQSFTANKILPDDATLVGVTITS